MVTNILCLIMRIVLLQLFKEYSQYASELSENLSYNYVIEWIYEFRTNVRMYKKTPGLLVY